MARKTKTVGKEAKENNLNTSNTNESDTKAIKSKDSKVKTKKSAVVAPVPPDCSKHSFTESEISSLRSDLLSWYDDNARVLPWRSAANPSSAQYQPDADTRGYMVWVSEVMLQQTQVATVIQYYNKWMSQWPTIKSLSEASLDSVNQAWSGLGYYSRARRLQEGAVKIMTELGGRMPNTATELMKLPGVGRYTAAAVASIAYGEVGGVVDGNVIRVLARIRCIGGEVGSNQVTDKMWGLVADLVDRERPGDFNQAMMELGAVVCTPKTPSCDTCPVKSVCLAVAQKTAEDIEDCGLCIKKGDYQEELGVLNYPRKGKKTASRNEVTLVVVLSSRVDDVEKFAMVQRPKTGLLANLLEFLSVTLASEDIKDKEQIQCLQDLLESRKLRAQKLTKVGPVVHVFSHINMTYVVYKGEVESGSGDDSIKWVSELEFEKCGTSTAMKKVFKSLSTKISEKESKKRKRTESSDSNQPSINSFFQPKIKKEKIKLEES